MGDNLSWCSGTSIERRAKRLEKFVRYIEVLFHTFYHYWGKGNRSLYRGFRYIEVRYIEVPLYLLGSELSEARKRIGIRLRLWSREVYFKNLSNDRPIRVVHFKITYCVKFLLLVQTLYIVLV